MPSPFYQAAFHRPVEDVDADGQVIQRYTLAFNDRANILFLRGTEAVMQARLASKSPAIVSIRDSVNARLVTSEWQVITAQGTFECREDPRPSKDSRRWLEILVERVG